MSCRLLSSYINSTVCFGLTDVLHQECSICGCRRSRTRRQRISARWRAGTRWASCPLDLHTGSQHVTAEVFKSSHTLTELCLLWEVTSLWWLSEMIPKQIIDHSSYFLSFIRVKVKRELIHTHDVVLSIYGALSVLYLTDGYTSMSTTTSCILQCRVPLCQHNKQPIRTPTAKTLCVRAVEDHQFLFGWIKIKKDMCCCTVFRHVAVANFPLKSCFVPWTVGMGMRSGVTGPEAELLKTVVSISSNVNSSASL